MELGSNDYFEDSPREEENSSQKELNNKIGEIKANLLEKLKIHDIDSLEIEMGYYK